MRKILLSIIVGLVGHSQLMGQQTPLFSQYYLNPFLLNPAFAGKEAEARAFFTYRKQWTGIEGAPETQAFTIDGALNNERMGIGLTLFNDITNVLGRANLMGTYSYGVDLSKDQHLNMGISIGVLQNKIYFDRINASDLSDPNLLNDVDNRTVLDGNIGMSYRYKDFLLGVAVTQIFQNEINHSNDADFKALNFSLIRHYTTTLQYDFMLNPKLKLVPMVLMRAAQGLSPQFDLSVFAEYHDILWLGTSYRTGIGTNFSMGFHIDSKFIIGYSYEVPKKAIRGLAHGSHEFSVGIRLNNLVKGGRANTSTSSVPNHSNYQGAPLDAAHQEKMDALEQRNQQLERKIERQNKELSAIRDMMEKNKEELSQLIATSAVDLSDADAFDADGEYYLVVGATRDIESAKNFQKMFTRETGRSTRVTQNSKKTWYLVFSSQPATWKEAKSEIKNLKKSGDNQFIIGNPWIYKAGE
ncbi:MAG: PorP/SprF family type IX secretion system membrane protein [Reichenbachiella sp.]|uniref:PorP/SprF family type IX secretion system membrane protein n=1 Tax=Reichenbachiella sp. TaxID=2184521 RepID=UPI0032657C2C